MHCFIIIIYLFNYHLTSLLVYLKNNNNNYILYNGTWVLGEGDKSKIIFSILKIEKAHEWYDCFVPQLYFVFEIRTYP